MKLDLYINLAKQAVESFITKGKIITPPKSLPKEMLKKRAGVFVSLHTKGEGVIPPSTLLSPKTKPATLFDGLPATKSYLRGCIGTYLPTQKNIAQEIIKNAISSACYDPRFPKVTREELPFLTYSVDVLSKPKIVKNKKSLDPKKYGLLVKGESGRQGLLLPNIPGVKTVKDQVEICRRKGGISPNEKITLYRFTVTRHKSTPGVE